MRLLLLLMALLTLSACAGVRDPAVAPGNTTQAGNWQIEKQIDRVTGVPLESALVVTSSSHSSEPFPKKATLQLACFNKKPLVRFFWFFSTTTHREGVSVRATMPEITTAIEIVTANWR